MLEKGVLLQISHLANPVICEIQIMQVCRGCKPESFCGDAIVSSLDDFEVLAVAQGKQGFYTIAVQLNLLDVNEGRYKVNRVQIQILYCVCES